MSNVYSIEPPTTAKVILKTNFGNIDIELWTKEIPRACRNFLQLCLEKYYNTNVFYRLNKGFMIQTGDPTNTGNGGESIWKKDFQDEFHSRLKFSHRGIVAMANKNSPNTNSSQFFITMDKCNWLDKKHTIFGKVVGDTFFNALTISELPVTKNYYPDTNTLPMIIDTEIIINPFLDITPRVKTIQSQLENTVRQKKDTDIEEKVKKDNRLISFMDEEEEDNNNSKLISKELESSIDQDLYRKDIEAIPENNAENLSANEDHSESSVSVEEGYVPENMPQISTGNRKQDVKQLKQEIDNLKQKVKLTPSELIKESVSLNKYNTPLQKHNEKYLHLKTKRPNTKEAISILDAFKANLSEAKQKSNHWMNNKLKFQIDSQRAYAIDQLKEMQKKNNLFD